MSGYKIHILISLMVSSVFVWLMHNYYAWYGITPTLIASVLVIIALSAIVSDIDSRHSRIHNILIGAGLGIAMIGVSCTYLLDHGYIIRGYGWENLIVWGVALAGFTFFAARLSKHRGIMHSIPFCIVYSIVISILTDYQLGVLALVGCYIHLCIDKDYLKLC